MTRFFLPLLLSLFLSFSAQPAYSSSAFEEVLGRNAKLIQKSSSRTVDPVLAEIQEFGGAAAAEFMQNWKDKTLYFVKADGRFVTVEATGKDDAGKKIVDVRDAVSKQPLGLMPAKNVKQIKPNSGVRAKIASALAPVQLTSDNIDIRRAGLAAISRDIQPSHLLPLQRAVATEIDASLKQLLEKTYKFAVITYGTDTAQIVAAINNLKGDLSLEARAVLNPLLVSKIEVARQISSDRNIARKIIPGQSMKRADGTSKKPGIFSGDQPELSLMAAYQMLVDKGYAREAVSPDMRDKSLVELAENGVIADIALSTLNTEQARNQLYDILVSTKGVPQRIDQEQMQIAVSEHVFYAVYEHPSIQVTRAARQVLASINSQVSVFKLLDLVLDGLSLASIYFLAAIGLAITFGVMRVINMAHGEFIMMGAYTGYVVQLIVPGYTLSILLAIPAAFCVTFAAGVLMERLVIRHLYKRPLETLLATFGISIALQQIAKNIFGTQARPLTSPSWLDGAFVVNDVLAISNIRVAIFCLGLLFLGLLLYVMTRTRFGLETRAVTQNPAMAASMGINPDRINMLTFGFGSGIAGIAGVAIGLFSKVTSELGSDYIVQSFMTVVVGGVGNIWGTLAGAAMIGSLQKAIEWLNPSNTLAAQTYMIIFIILFIQFRPRGIIALKGRAAED